MESNISEATWEAMFAPYDQPTYQAVLDQIQPHDIILDIGAGDLRLARQMAQIARQGIRGGDQCPGAGAGPRCARPVTCQLDPDLRGRPRLDFPIRYHDWRADDASLHLLPVICIETADGWCEANHYPMRAGICLWR